MNHDNTSTSTGFDDLWSYVICASVFGNHSWLRLSYDLMYGPFLLLLFFNQLFYLYHQNYILFVQNQPSKVGSDDRLYHFKQFSNVGIRMKENPMYKFASKNVPKKSSPYLMTYDATAQPANNLIKKV